MDKKPPPPSDAATRLIPGTRWGDVYPCNPISIKNRSGDDARTAAMRVLKDYFAELTFWRTGGVCQPPIPFKVHPDAIYIGQPDNDVDLQLPVIMFDHAEEEYNGFGFTPDVIESTRDVYQFGTVLLHHYTQQEEFIIEVWSAKQPERRALVAGLQTAFMPSDEYYGLRFRLPEYFDQPVVFTPMSNMRIDDEAIRGRRIFKMKVEYRIEVVTLVAYAELNPQAVVNTYEQGDPTAMTLGELAALGIDPILNTPQGYQPVALAPPEASPWYRSPWLAKAYPFIDTVLDLARNRRRPRPQTGLRY